MSTGEREPIFNVPFLIVLFIGVLAGVHLLRWAIAPAADNALIELLAFNPARYGGEGREMPGSAWAGPAGFFSHAFLHGDLTHLLINSAWFMAVGSVLARRMPAWAFIAFFGLCAAGGALMFLLMHPGVDAALVGASGAISGLMAAVLRLMFAAEDAEARYLLREQPLDAPRLSIRSTLTRKAPLTAIGAWVVVNFVAAAALTATGETAGAIAWEAHLGGFFTGLLTFDLFDRGNPEETAAGRPL